MSYFFSDHFKTALAANQNLMDGQKVKLVLFRYAPTMGFPTPAWTAARTVAELTAQPGWAEATGIGGYPLTMQADVSSRTVGGSRYIMFSNYPFSGLTEVAEVRAIGVVFVGTLAGQTNPIIFVTNTPIGEAANLKPSDALTANPDTTFPDQTNRWLLGWGVTTPEPIEGPLVISRGSPEFEVSGSQHAWLYPQRANMIANPSFEKPGTDFWSANSVLNRVSIPGGWAGQCAGTGGYAIMESNIFPTQMGELDSEQWTVQLLARGTGKLKVGFVFWDADYRVTAVDWGQDETYTLSPDSWLHIATHRFAPEGHIAMLRLELEGSGLTVDKVLAERGYLKDWLYFDGDEHYGARDDFSWYGGSNRQGATYSFWYNHRKAVTGRLFARTVDPNDPDANVTDEDMEEQGLVYRWVPAGITVVPHLDVLYPFDTQSPLPPKPAGVLPRATPATPDGVSDPWA